MSTAYLTKPPVSVSETVSFDKVARASHKSYPTRTIRLFDSKYVGIFNTHMECVAFVKVLPTPPLSAPTSKTTGFTDLSPVLWPSFGSRRTNFFPEPTTISQSFAADRIVGARPRQD
jgi:hypothetical protein